MVNLKKTKINFNKKNNKSINLLIKYLPCFFKGEILIVLGILVLSLAYYKVSSYDSYLYYFTFLFVALGAFITGRATYNRLGGRGIISGFLGSLPIAIINIAIILIVFSGLGTFSGLSPVGTQVICAFGTSVALPVPQSKPIE